MEDIIILRQRKRVLAGNKIKYYAAVLGGEAGEAMHKTADAMAVNITAEEECALQNRRASKSKLPSEFLGGGHA